jgi:predicted NodU family carbamoyl transferase
MENGEIKYLLSEERFTNIKNQGGFPQNALEYLQNQSEISLEDLDHIF